MIPNHRIKHLEVVQSVINRLASNAFLIKGWFLTISLAEIGFYIEHVNLPFIFPIIIVTALVFWIFDAYYLAAERKFRCLFDRIADGNVHAFSMHIANIRGYKYSTVGAMLSFPTWIIYISSIASAFIIYISCF